MIDCFLVKKSTHPRSPFHIMERSTSSTSSGSASEIPPDASISHADALKYWNSITPTVNGMLGGYPQISRIDLQGSMNFVAKLRRKQVLPTGIPKSKPALLKRVVDCGAGIGRITAGFLVNIAETIDIVEPVVKFTDEISKGSSFAQWREQGKIGEIFNVGLEDWTPRQRYSLVWNQWCLGQLTDDQLRAYLQRCAAMLEKDGWILVKENLSTSISDEDIFDEIDSSVTRSDLHFRAIFEAANLRIVATEIQKGFPKDLYPVKIYALQSQP